MSTPSSQQTTIQVLHDGWRVRDVRGDGDPPTTALPWLPALIPGHIHLDLMAAGVIADPFKNFAERGAQWVDETDWVYETTFFVTEPIAAHTLLRFEGLDTIAEIVLNETVVGHADNMFIPHEFEVGHVLQMGENTLRVTFASAMRVGRERQAVWTAKYGDEKTKRDWQLWGPRSFVRKAQYMYGWDWGPTLVSCGLWRPMGLVSIPVARLLDWKYDVTFTEDQAIVDFTIFVDRAPDASETPLTVTIDLPRAGNDEEEFDAPLPDTVSVDVPAGVGRIEVTAQVVIDEPELWWPNRHNPEGESIHPALYALEIALHADEEIDIKTGNIGLRTIELIQEADADGKGESFQFRVNGEDIFIKGANWIPADSFPARLVNEPGYLDGEDDGGDARVFNLVGMACDAGYNMLRVWGGGLYETEHFYELCDRHGLLVWQDFGYACAYYPDLDEYAEAARTEAVAAIRRIRNHPSLALWCGNNENHMMHIGKWAAVRPSRLLGEHLYHDVLPAVVEAEDPQTPYWPSSPYGGDNPNSSDFGDKHNWDVWHGVGDWTNYADDNARFASEFGFAAAAGLRAWNNCLTDSDLTPESLAMRWHDKTRKGYDAYLDLVKLHYPEMKSLDDLVYYTQLNQADALKFGVEHYRRLKGRCWGTLFWQINDCWPTHSWAVIDSELEPRAAHYASARFYAPMLVSIVRTENAVEVHLVNDTLSADQGTLEITLQTFEGETLAHQSWPISIEENSAALAAIFPLNAGVGRETETFVHARFTPTVHANAAENLLFLAEPKELELDDPELGIELLEHEESGFLIALTARRFAANIWLQIDLADTEDSLPTLSDNFFHLRAGDSKVVHVEETDTIDSVESLAERLTVRSLYGYAM
jgi:beta-mannosidase